VETAFGGWSLPVAAPAGYAAIIPFRSHPMRLAYSLALAALAAAALTATADKVEPEGGPVKDRANYLPKQKHAALKGKAVGILVSDVKAMMAQEGRGGPADAMGFSAGGYSYRWIYVPAENEKTALIQKLNVEVGEKTNDKRKQYPA